WRIVATRTKALGVGGVKEVVVVRLKVQPEFRRKGVFGLLAAGPARAVVLIAVGVVVQREAELGVASAGGQGQLVGELVGELAEARHLAIVALVVVVVDVAIRNRQLRRLRSALSVARIVGA